MKVFLSWSGDRGKSVAKPMKAWLEAVLPGTDAFFSQTDIEKGAVWREKLADELRTSDVAVVCLTPEALRSPWVMFETGAISGAVRGKRICPVLFGVEPDGVKGPVSDFQLTVYEREDLFRLAEALNEVAKGSASRAKLRARFDERWAELDGGVRKALETVPSAEFTQQLVGFWWERHRSKGRVAVSWMEARIDRAHESVSFEGSSYATTGDRLSHWETRVASVDREKRQVEYYWEGEDYDRPGLPLGGYGEVTFERATPVRRGEGCYFDVSLDGRREVKKRLVYVRRAARAEEHVMRDGDAAAQKALVLKVVRALG